jgi:hypothetical protein
MALPMADCSSYKVGNCPTNMKEHTLPQLRTFKQKRKQLMVKGFFDIVTCQCKKSFFFLNIPIAVDAVF